MFQNPIFSPAYHLCKLDNNQISVEGGNCEVKSVSVTPYNSDRYMFLTLPLPHLSPVAIMT